MAGAQLKIVDLKTGAVAGGSSSSPTPTLQTAKTCDLSDKTRVTAHPGDKYKAGYMTFSRLSSTRLGWRNVHLSKTAFEKLGKELDAFQEALKVNGEHQVMLHKKQHVLTSRFVRDGKDTLHYVSVMHPTEEKEKMSPKDEVNHAKTINLSREEFYKFVEAFETIAEVVRSRASKGENDEAAVIEGFRWTCRHTGNRSAKIFLSLEQCIRDADRHFYETHPDELQAQLVEPMECERETNFDFFAVFIDRPSKLDVIEHLAYVVLVKKLAEKNDDVPPPEKSVDDVVENLNRSYFAILVKKVLAKLAYKNLYLSGELISLFMYFGGMEKVKSNLVKHTASCTGRQFTRVVDYCHDVVSEEINKD